MVEGSFITEPEQVEHIIASGEADAVFLARAMLAIHDGHLWLQRDSVTELIGRCRWIGEGLFNLGAFRGIAESSSTYVHERAPMIKSDQSAVRLNSGFCSDFD
jgi:hypothetical protein